MKRPLKNLNFIKTKKLAKAINATQVERATLKISFAFSLYHGCPNRPRPKPRTKPASHCPRDWTNNEAINAIRRALKNGHISESWTADGFPRHLWYKEGDIWYEGRTSENASGEYHGYPIEIEDLPSGLIK